MQIYVRLVFRQSRELQFITEREKSVSLAHVKTCRALLFVETRGDDTKENGSRRWRRRTTGWSGIRYEGRPEARLRTATSHLRCDRCEPSANALAIISPSPWPSSSSCLMLTARWSSVVQSSPRVSDLSSIGRLVRLSESVIKKLYVFGRYILSIRYCFENDEIVPRRKKCSRKYADSSPVVLRNGAFRVLGHAEFSAMM